MLLGVNSFTSLDIFTEPLDSYDSSIRREGILLSNEIKDNNDNNAMQCNDSKDNNNNNKNAMAGKQQNVREGL